MGVTSMCVGPGVSNGKRKPNNQWCHCGGCEADEPEKLPPRKLGCRVNVSSDNKTSYSAKNGGSKLKVC